MLVAAPASALRTARAASVLAGVSGGLVVALALAAAVGRWSNRDVAGTEFVEGYWTLLVVGGATYGASGGWLATVRPRLRLGWLMLAVGALLSLAAVSAEYAIAAVDRHPGWPLVGTALWLAVWAWAPAYLLVGLVLPLVVPEGRLPSRRHRPLVGLALFAVVGNAVVFAVTPYDEQVPRIAFGGLRNPTAMPWWDAVWLRLPAAVLTVACLVAGLVVLARKWHTAGPDRPALSTTVLGLLATIAVALLAFVVPEGWVPLLLALAAVPFPVSCVVAVLRDGLGDVDVVLSRALAYGMMSAVAAGAYVVLVGLLGGLLGSGIGAPALVTAVVAVAVAPLHRRVQRLVNRVVHGTSEDPYAALARLGERLESAQDPERVVDDALPALVAALGRALRRPVALVLRDGTVVDVPVAAAAARAPLTYAGEALGELVVGAGSRPMSRGEHRLLDSLARQAAVAVHGVLLGRDLARSREQIVSAREEERRRLRHDLHDGVGPTLAAAALQVETARATYQRDPEMAGVLLDTVAARLAAAVDDVRRVVRGLRPAGLDDLGLPEALAALARRFESTGRSVVVEVGELPPRSAAVDAAAYLVAAEALTNAVRHGAARRVLIEVSLAEGGLALAVEDDGRGIPAGTEHGTGLRSMCERVEQLGGWFRVASRPGGGTQVSVWLPGETR